MKQLKIDQTLLKCVLDGTIHGLAMTGIEPEPVGASRLFTGKREYSVLVSFYNERNGSMTLNFSEHTIAYLTSRLMFKEVDKITEEAFDAICEIGNMIAG